MTAVSPLALRLGLALGLGLCVGVGLPARAQMPPPGEVETPQLEFEGYHPEVVFFQSAPGPPPSPFQQKVAKEKGIALESAEPQTVLGRLFRPEGDGPFPAVVLLHGSTGIWEWNDLWAERLRSWGYLVLDVDSLTPRGLYRHNSGAGPGYGGLPRRIVGSFPRSLDALGAAAFLAGRPDVTQGKIAVLGMSEGGSSVLYALSPRDRPQPSNPFAAGIALYPACHGFESFDAPLMVLIGSADEFVSVKLCKDLLGDFAGQHELVFEVYPEAHHVFDFNGPERKWSGRTLRHDPAAATDAEARIKGFLEKYLN